MKRRLSERGQSLVELAISLVILLYLLSGAVEFGIAFFQYVQLRDAAQEGALYASMNPSDGDGIEARIRGASTSPIDLADTSLVDVEITVNTTLAWRNGSQQATTTSGCEGNGVTVVVSYDHRIFMPFMPQLIGRTVIPLNATVTDTILSPLCPGPGPS